MEVKQAVQIAKNYIHELYEDENIMNLGLEEIEYVRGEWKITVGFSRSWDKTITNVLSGSNARSYKILSISDKKGEVLSMKERQIEIVR